MADEKQSKDPNAKENEKYQAVAGMRSQVEADRANKLADQQENHYVEDADGNRAPATPDSEEQTGIFDNMPEPEYVGLEKQKLVDAGKLQQMQREEQFPPIPDDFFDPEAYAEERDIYTTISGTCFVAVNEGVVHEGRYIPGGVNELPEKVAKALVADKKAWQPVGQKPL